MHPSCHLLDGTSPPVNIGPQQTRASFVRRMTTQRARFVTREPLERRYAAGVKDVRTRQEHLRLQLKVIAADRTTLLGELPFHTRAFHGRPIRGCWDHKMPLHRRGARQGQHLLGMHQHVQHSHPLGQRGFRFGSCNWGFRPQIEPQVRHELILKRRGNQGTRRPFSTRRGFLVGNRSGATHQSTKSTPFYCSDASHVPQQAPSNCREGLNGYINYQYAMPIAHYD